MMNTTSNRVSATLSPADQEAIEAALATLKEKLPFLIGLTPDERRTLPKMGDKSRAFVQRSLELAQQNEGILPRAFDLEEMQRDLDLYNTLYPIYLAVSQLNELLADTLTEVGSEAYTAALVVYNSAKMYGQAAGLDEALDELGQRFARKSRGADPSLSN